MRFACLNLRTSAQSLQPSASLWDASERKSRIGNFEQLKARYAEAGCVIVTAHRGFSGKHPENTLEAFDAAVALGVDFVEFDVRCSKDGVPVVMHDETVDRCTDGHGRLDGFPLDKLKKLNASYWDGPHDTGKRLAVPGRIAAPVPTLEETLERLAGKVFLNIQVYAENLTGLAAICRLYRAYSLYRSAFLMMGTFAAAAAVKNIDAKVETCVGEDRENLERHKAFGSTFIQPWRASITPELCRKIRSLKLCANMFYANTAGDCHKYADCGVQGIMSDRPDIIIEQTRELKF